MTIRQYISKTLYALSCAIVGAFCVFVVYVGLKAFVCDSFSVNSHSMAPAIQPGDRVFVNKLLFGARIYRNLRFLEGGRLQTFKIKGFRGIRHNDVVVFNHTVGDEWYRTGFAVNGVYVKRCLGLPGDTLSIVNGAYRNSSVEDRIMHEHFPYPKGKMMIEPSILNSYPFDGRVGWTVLDFGPLYIPRRGDTIGLTLLNALIYGKYIEYETGARVEIKGDSVCLDGVPACSHTFENSYYFMAGDNFPDSRDSRYFGLIPEEFIVGIAPMIVFSRDKYAKRINRDRIFKPI
ncbi:MAG: signal peptidase I [Rikenellaceae bacterium]|jgi:signal peptidase I|nr:signal peptidase I [Rikenellaceae bacterium]